MKNIIDLAPFKSCNSNINWCPMGFSHCKVSCKKILSLILEDLGNNEASGVGVVAAIWLPHYANMLALDWGGSTIDICDSPHRDLTHPWHVLHDWASRVLCAFIFSG